jgi:hypothetical protein
MPPTEADLLDGLARTLGTDATNALWNRVCAFEGFRRPVTDSGQLLRGAQAVLAETDGSARMTARCFVIKISNFRALTKEAAA